MATTGRKSGEIGYWAFMMSERRAQPHLSKEALTVHCSKLWRKGGYDSYGRPLEQLLTREAQEQAEMLRMKGDVKDWVEMSHQAGTLQDLHFYIIQANVFCLTEEKGVVPAEICLARVSLKDGVQEVYHEFINPGPLPLGYRADCMANSAKTHQIPLQLDLANSNYGEMVEGMVQFVGREGSSLPGLYMLPRYQRQTRLVLDWLQDKVTPGVRSALQLSSLPCLLFHMVRVGRELPGGIQVPTESLAEVQLDRDVFLYGSGVACSWHEEQDQMEHCSAGIVRRWSYILLHLACPRHCVELLPGRHLPPLVPRESVSSCTSASSHKKASTKSRRPRAPPSTEVWLPSTWGTPA